MTQNYSRSSTVEWVRFNWRGHVAIRKNIPSTIDFIICNNFTFCRLGVGATSPNSATYYKDEKTGVVYPIGLPVTSAEIKSDLLYNEFIVYNTAQVKQKYLVWVEFKFNY